MTHVYTVEFHFKAECLGRICKCVLAEDRYEALVMARQLLALQDPAVEGEDVRMCQVLRQDVAKAG